MVRHAESLIHIEIFIYYIILFIKNKIVIIITVVIVLMFAMISFSNFIYHNNIDIKNNPEASENNIKKDSPYGHYYWGLGNPIGSIYLWTPVILINSPYKGCASVSSGQSFKTQYTVAGWSSCTQTAITVKLCDIDNGESEGLFYLGYWTIYPIVLKWSSSGGGCPGPKPANYAAEITKTTGSWTTCVLNPENSKSDVNEKTSFNFNGYNSIIISNGFNTNTWNTCSPNIACYPHGSGCFSFTTDYYHEEKIGFSINAVFSGATYIVSGTLSLIATLGSWCWGTFSYHYNSFTYKIPLSAEGEYEMEALNTGDSHDMAYAFRWCN